MFIRKSRVLLCAIEKKAKTNHNNAIEGGFPLTQFHSKPFLEQQTRKRPENLTGLSTSAFAEVDGTTTNANVLEGLVTRQLTSSVYAVEMTRQSYLSPIVEVGSRVFVGQRSPGEDDQAEFTSFIGGIVVRVNGNGSLIVLLDNNSIDMSVPTSHITLNFGQAFLFNQQEYLHIVDWVRTSGVVRRLEQESIAAVLFMRGWRVDKLYLLEAADVHCMTFIAKSIRMCVLDKSEWQRDHHRQMRQLMKERVKEKDFRYRLTKYSGVISASMAFLGIAIAFAWNLKNYRNQQRKFQLSFAVKRLLGDADPRTNPKAARKEEKEVKEGEKRTHFVDRSTEVDTVTQVLRQLDTSHPRVVVLTGRFGCGKSTVGKQAIARTGLHSVQVDIRGGEDTLRSITKALGVPNLDVCGDLLDFVAAACRECRTISGSAPLLVLRLRGAASLQRVYNDAISLACDRRVCHLIIEVPLESLTMANTSLPRLDFYTVPLFTPRQAFDYTQHTVDPLSLQHFIEVVGTNSNDLDELFAAVNQRSTAPTNYINHKLVRAMRHLQSVCANSPASRTALHRLASFPFESGQHSGVDSAALRHPRLKDIVLYDPVRDAWLFRSKVLHTATLSCWGVGRKGE